MQHKFFIFTHVVICINSFFLFLPRSQPLCELTQSLIEVHLGCFQFGGIICKMTVDMFVQVFLGAHVVISLGSTPRRELLGHRVRNYQGLGFPKLLYHVHSHIYSGCSLTLTTFVSSVFFILALKVSVYWYRSSHTFINTFPHHQTFLILLNILRHDFNWLHIIIGINGP